MNSEALQELESRGCWMDTFTGKVFYPLDPRPEEVDFRDIAHALSMLGRYCGHTTMSQPYSVGHHVLLCHDIGSELNWKGARNLPLHCLFHDFHEAYIGDVVAPLKVELKRVPGVEEWWNRMEDRLDGAIYQAGGLDPPSPEERRVVKAVDNIALVLETDEVLANGASYRELFMSRIQEILPWLHDVVTFRPYMKAVMALSEARVERAILSELNSWGISYD